MASTAENQLLQMLQMLQILQMLQKLSLAFVALFTMTVCTFGSVAHAQQDRSPGAGDALKGQGLTQLPKVMTPIGQPPTVQVKPTLLQRTKTLNRVCADDIAANNCPSPLADTREKRKEAIKATYDCLWAHQSTLKRACQRLVEQHELNKQSAPQDQQKAQSSSDQQSSDQAQPEPAAASAPQPVAQ